MSVEQPKRVTVWWNDAHATKESIDHKDAVGKYHTPYPVATIGWLVKQDGAGVSIAHSWNPPNGHFEPWDYRDLHFFPQGTITKVEVMDVSKKKSKQAGRAAAQAKTAKKKSKGQNPRGGKGGR